MVVCQSSELKRFQQNADGTIGYFRQVLGFWSGRNIEQFMVLLMASGTVQCRVHSLFALMRD